MSTDQVLIQSLRRAALWAIARWSGLAAVPPLLAWLVLEPTSALTALWYLTVPVLPATFFLSTTLWRGVCPLATLNEVGNRLGRPRAPTPRMLSVLSVGGLVLFHLMVPARHFLFNEHGGILAATIATVAGLAVLLGARFPVRSAFCNALCPVRPIELLYGQSPLVSMERGRCPTCTGCTPRGCLDLSETKAIPQLLGSARRTWRWLATPHGVFFAALPGFIIGYDQVRDGPLGGAGITYVTTLGWSLASVLVVGALVAAFRLPLRLTLPLLAAGAGALYYWYAGPAIMTQLAAGPGLAYGIRTVGMGLVGSWLFGSLSRTDRGATAAEVER